MAHRNLAVISWLGEILYVLAHLGEWWSGTIAEPCLLWNCFNDALCNTKTLWESSPWWWKEGFCPESLGQCSKDLNRVFLVRHHRGRVGPLLFLGGTLHALPRVYLSYWSLHQPNTGAITTGSGTMQLYSTSSWSSTGSSGFNGWGEKGTTFKPRPRFKWEVCSTE